MSWIIIGGRTGLSFELTKEGEPECKGYYCYHDCLSAGGHPQLTRVGEENMVWSIKVPKTAPPKFLETELDKRVREAPDHTHGMLRYGHTLVQCDILVPMRTYLHVQDFLQLVLTSTGLEYVLDISFDFRRDWEQYETPPPTPQEFADGKLLLFDNAVTLRVRDRSVAAAAQQLIKFARALFDDDKARAAKWYREPISEFNQKTPEQLAIAGRADDILRYLAAKT